jgi:hypothetical protein
LEVEMEQSMTPAGPPEPPAAGEPPAPAGSRRRAAWIALAVLALAAVAVAAYFLGRSAANAPRAYDRGYAQGRKAMAQEFAPGTPRYQRIYTAGFRAGRTAGMRIGERAGAEKGAKVGLEHGKAIGRLQGERRGIASGAGAALGGFASWQTGNYYIVKLAPGGQGVPYRIDVRKIMDTNKRYAICANDPADVCTKPITRR